MTFCMNYNLDLQIQAQPAIFLSQTTEPRFKQNCGTLQLL